MTNNIHNGMLIDLGNVVISCQEHILKLDEDITQNGLKKVKQAASNANHEILNAINKYENKKKLLKKSEVNDIYHAKQMKITNIVLTGTKKIMELDDYDYHGFSRVINWIKTEQSKLRI